MSRGLAATLLAALVASLVVPGTALAARRPPPPTSPKAPPVVLEAPCPDSIFSCITIRVPRDHFNPAGPTVDVTFALHRAIAKARKGVFVTVTGGPGTSGIAAADRYTASYDPRIVRDYDIVFFDQRGIGRSLPFQCPDAALALATSPHVPTVSPASALAYADDARAFVPACVAESGIDPAVLPFISTRQAVEDLEAFRILLKARAFDLYAESYGTQYAQTYAAAHPTRVGSMVLDGPVDLTLSGFEYHDESADAFDDVLATTLDRCTADAVCRRDAGGRDALAAYDALAATLRRGPLTYDFVDATGRVERRSFELGDLETAVAGSIQVGSDRMLIERAIAWAAHGQLLPLARLAYLARGQDPETLTALPNPAWSKAMFYGLECTDYAFGFGTGDEAARAYLAAGTTAAVAEVRIGSVFYGDLPCAYWPAHPSTAERPEYLTSTPYPVFVLTSTTDAATPYAGALRIMSHLTDGYLVVQPDGPHVIFGRGTPCVDDPVAAYLVDGVLPGTRFVTCDFSGADPYVPIPAAAAGEYRDALAAMSAVDDELTTSAAYRKWNRGAPLAFGCLFGGSLTYTPSRNGSTVALDDCAVSDGLPLTGTATIDGTRGTLVLQVSGPRTTGLAYARDARGKMSVTGTYFGKPVSLTGQAVSRARR